MTSPDRIGAPSRLASAVSGSSTGSVASLAPGAVAHSPVNAIIPSPSADTATAGSGRASGLDLSARISTPIMASTRPPGIGGSASLVAGAAAGSWPVMMSRARSVVLRFIAPPRRGYPWRAPGRARAGGAESCTRIRDGPGPAAAAMPGRIQIPSPTLRSVTSPRRDRRAWFSPIIPMPIDRKEGSAITERAAPRCAPGAGHRVAGNRPFRW